MYQIESINIHTLKDAEYNPRTASKKEVSDLKESIKRFGLVDPIIVNKSKNRRNIIIGGHFRVHIAKELGITEIPVVYVNIPDINKEQELNLRLNKNVGNWNYDLLANLNEDLLIDVGFDTDILKDIFPIETKEDDFDAQAEAKKIKKPKSKLGEIYILGNHRLMCGDSTKKEDVDKLMDGQKADMVFTDPPYNISFNYENYKDNYSEENYFKFCCKWFELIKNVNKIIITPGPRNLLIWEKIKKPIDIGIWKKDNSRSGATVFYFRLCEPIVFYGKFENKRNVDIFEYARSIDSIKTESEKSANIENVAPAKPIKLICDLLNNYSINNNIILDLFGGSGSTLIACEQTNRKCYMMELEPIYCDVIKNRYDKFVNQINEKN